MTASTRWRYDPLAAQSLDDPDPHYFPTNTIIGLPSIMKSVATSNTVSSSLVLALTEYGPTLDIIWLLSLILVKVPLHII